MEFEKFTTRYDEYQDRICVDGQTAAGQVTTLWLTYRLLRRLLPVLLEIITPAPGADPNAATLAAWELNTARARQKPQKAVVRPPARIPAVAGKPTALSTQQPSGWLVQSIDLKSLPTRTLLVFRTAVSEEEATFAFGADHLRQWLAIVYGQWQVAGWSLEVWPAWVKGVVETPPRQSPGTLVH